MNKAEAGNRKITEGRDTLCGKTRTRDKGQSNRQDQLQHLENGDWKPFGITKIGKRIMSIITVGGHEVTRNLSEPSDQTLMNIDVYADYLRTISSQTPSTALRALLTRGRGKSIRIDSSYTEAYGPHEVMLDIDGINIYSKTIITFDEHLTGQIYVGREELNVRSIGQS